uniref:Uncharacterized protein n=1 Tax=Anguilla anguilla TaxID=7936 RepID=A0A0E9V1Q1_ANGAN
MPLQQSSQPSGCLGAAQHNPESCIPAVIGVFCERMS